MRYQHRFVVNAPLERVREFHSRSSGMGALTPPPVFVQMHRAPERLAEGDEMEFTLWLGPLPVHWLARMSDVTPTGFLDTQVRGPFARWEHRHTFAVVDADRSEVIDTLEVVPGGNIFRRAVGWSMALSLPLLFAFRQWKTRRLLENKPYATLPASPTGARR